MLQSRTANARRNIIASYLYIAVNTIFQFVFRSIIVYALGKKYLGLSSLFSSVLQVLNMAEIGFSGAIVYNMYKPLAEGDTETVCALLAFYKKIYRIIGIIILLAGIIITPFISYLIHDTIPDDLNIYILYILYLLNTCTGYFLFAYKTSLLEAVQRLDIVKLSNIVVSMIQYILQIAALICFQDYYMYLAAMVIGTALQNTFVAVISKRVFPQYECKGKIGNTEKKNISARVRGLLVCRISGVTYTSFDSIIISVFISLSSVAVYNNYIIIFTAIQNIIIQLRFSMQAGVGNSVATESKEKNYSDILLWQFLFSMITSWCMTCLICLYQPFMRLWMGEDMLLPMTDVILIGIWFMVETTAHAHYLYITGDGLWDKLKAAYIFSTIFNIVMNILLGKLGGITGIILASLLSSFISGTIWQSIIVFKYYFERSAVSYFIRQMLYMAAAFAVCIITYMLCGFVLFAGIWELVGKALICLIVPTTLLLFIYHRTESFDKAIGLMKRVSGVEKRK